MSIDTHLLRRIRAEYHEMPGLRLSVAQASRMWQLDPASCRLLLERLVVDGHLHRTHDGAYVAFPTMRPRTAKARLGVRAADALGA